MGQFKPRVKMMTTEPTVELKLKKGGSVEKKMQMGGALAPTATPAPAAMPASMPASGGAMPSKSPMRPSLAARRRMMRAMPAGAAPAAPVGSAAQVMKKGGETKAEFATGVLRLRGVDLRPELVVDTGAGRAGAQYQCDARPPGSGCAPAVAVLRRPGP